MEQYTQNQTTDGQVDRTLAVTCRPLLIWHGTNPPNIGATAVYTQAGSNPNMPNRVSTNGDLKLDHLPSNANFNDNVDVTITLDTSGLVDPNGNPVQGRWAFANEGPLMLGSPTGFCWFCTVTNSGSRQYDPTPITISDMSTSRLSDTQVLIDDDTVNSDPDYAFCLGLVLPQYNNYYITLDPIIGSKGKST
jgi:hypothetical protein